MSSQTKDKKYSLLLMYLTKTLGEPLNSILQQ